MTSDIKFLTLEQQNKDPVISRGQSHIMLLTSHDIIGVIGMGWVSGVGVDYGKLTSLVI